MQHPKGSLADTILNTDWGSKAASYSRKADHAAEDMSRTARAIKHAALYRMDRDAFDFTRHIASQMAERPGQVEHVRMPAGLCFFEYPWMDASEPGHIARTGVLFVGRLPSLVAPTYDETDLRRCLTEGSTTQGTVILIGQNDTGSIMLTSGIMDLTKGVVMSTEDGDVTHPFLAVNNDTMNDLIQGTGSENAALDLIDDMAFMTAALGAVLTSPKVIELRVNDVTRLNIKRAKQNKPPLVSHRDVLLKIPKPVETRSAPSPDHDASTAKRGKVRHMVTLFTRIKRGKIEVVSPHWRGDPALGIKMPRFFAKGG